MSPDDLLTLDSLLKAFDNLMGPFDRSEQRAIDTVMAAVGERYHRAANMATGVN